MAPFLCHQVEVFWWVFCQKLVHSTEKPCAHCNVKHQPSEEVFCPICDLGANTWEQPAIAFQSRAQRGIHITSIALLGWQAGWRNDDLFLPLPSCGECVSVPSAAKLMVLYGSLDSLGISETTI
jgi:hypothetical protein